MVSRPMPSHFKMPSYILTLRMAQKRHTKIDINIDITYKQMLNHVIERTHSWNGYNANIFYGILV